MSSSKYQRECSIVMWNCCRFFIQTIFDLILGGFPNATRLTEMVHGLLSSTALMERCTFAKKNVFLIIIKQNLHWSKTKQKCMVKIAAWQQCVTKKLSKCIFCSPEISPKCQVLLFVSKTEVVLHVGLLPSVWIHICCKPVFLCLLILSWLLQKTYRDVI